MEKLGEVLVLEIVSHQAVQHQWVCWVDFICLEQSLLCLLLLLQVQMKMNPVNLILVVLPEKIHYLMPSFLSSSQFA